MPLISARLKKRKQHLHLDILFLSGSVAAAIAIWGTGVVPILLETFQGFEGIGIFVAGFFFTSALTIVPATVVLGQIANHAPIFFVAVLGGIGATIGDYLLFRFFAGRVAEDLHFFLTSPHLRKFSSAFRSASFRWTLIILGAFVIVSPLPDEVGLAMMGISHMKNKVFIPLSFVLNTIGILVVAIAARSLS
jgi:hypothetical protein